MFKKKNKNDTTISFDYRGENHTLLDKLKTKNKLKELYFLIQNITTVNLYFQMAPAFVFWLNSKRL